ncbi:MAG: putative HTH-type transcriptional regulator [Pseudonocardiales bacterium]|nr:putative HTH-type transcriptional regulator [Pseudonocardiales bacterium]
MTYPHEDADLTTRARIREAALALIAEVGVHDATMRAIAKRSNVSPGLISHHFGSKQAIVDEVSAWVLRLLRQEALTSTAANPADAAQDRLAAFGRMLRETPHVTGFLRRMLLDGRNDGVAWFRQAIEVEAQDLRIREQAGRARPSCDVEAEAAMLLVITLAPLILQPLLEQALEVDFSTEAGRARWGDVQRELLTSAVYPPMDPAVAG